MALTRKFLTALGIEAEKIDEIITAHTDTVDALKADRDKFKADAERLPAVQKELDELKAHPGDDYKAKYEKAKKEFEDFKAETEKQAALAAKKAAYTDVCKDAGLSEKGIAKALKYAEWDKIELDDAGKIANPKEHIKALKEEWAEHIVTTHTRGAETGNPPANNGGLMSRAEIYKKDGAGRFVMDATERQAQLSKLIAAETQQKG